jgi:hypothetical protein
MKKIKQHILVSLLVLMVFLTSCFEERDDDFKIVGAVATIPVLTLSKSGTSNIPVVAGEQITVSFRYYSEHVVVNELRLTETIGTGTATVVQTKTVSGFDTKNSYNDSFVYTVPALASGTTIRLGVEVQTENSLVNSRTAPNLRIN